MPALGLYSLFGIVAYLSTFGILIPSELAVFRILAAAGTMAGFSCGDVAASHVKRPVIKVGIVLLALLFCCACGLLYAIRIQAGSANVSDIILLGVVLTGFFFSFAFLMPVAGVKLVLK